MNLTPHRGGIVTRSFYANGKATWRCAQCGFVNPWTESWGWWSILDEEQQCGILAGEKTNWIVWCSDRRKAALAPWRVEGRAKRRRSPR